MELATVKSESLDLDKQTNTQDFDVKRNNKDKVEGETQNHVGENGKFEHKIDMENDCTLSFTRENQTKEDDSNNTKWQIETSEIDDPGRCKIITFIDVKDRKDAIIKIIKLVLLLAYFVYFGFALAHKFGDEGSLRLVVCTVFGVLLALWFQFKKTRHHKNFIDLTHKLYRSYKIGNRSRVTRW